MQTYVVPIKTKTNKQTNKQSKTKQNKQNKKKKNKTKQVKKTTKQMYTKHFPCAKKSCKARKIFVQLWGTTFMSHFKTKILINPPTNQPTLVKYSSYIYTLCCMLPYSTPHPGSKIAHE